ncbi:FAD-binding protein [Barrientosiimonas endolithica]|uniref:FAD-binding protein n=1 Tax=Barrientosiimonas endolithica TaxID=1535208 RepID=A0ABM8H7M7_9MICO|nr:FAD-binding protein [Barrientosiimonas endolithica]
MAERSWSGTLTYSGEVVRPSALAEVPALLAAHERVRILGTRHSFSAIGDTDGVLIDLSGLPPDLSFDEASGEVSLGCGARYADVVPFLQRRGRALPNTGSLPHINVAGAVSSGTHGSGDRLRNLSSAVREVQLLTAEGEQVTLRRGEHPDLAGAVVALGALGVVTRLTLATEPTYDVRQDVYVGLDRAAFLADPDALLGAGYSVSVFTDWDGRPLPETVVKRRIGSADDAPAPLLGVDPVGEWVGDSRISSEPESLTARGVSGPWHERLPHFRIERPPSHGAELQSEWFVPRERTGEALEAVSRVGDRLREALIVSEIRTMAADDLWLSPATGATACACTSPGVPTTTWCGPRCARSRRPSPRSRLVRTGARCSTSTGSTSRRPIRGSPSSVLSQAGSTRRGACATTSWSARCGHGAADRSRLSAAG